VKGTSEKRNLDWQYRPHSDHIFGDVSGRSRWIKVEDIGKDIESEGVADDAKYLAEGWDDEIKNAEALESYVINEDNGWTAWQIWGIAVVEGARRQVRRVVVRKGTEVKRIRLVYDWAGKLDA
jgi:hypothetical protein